MSAVHAPHSCSTPKATSRRPPTQARVSVCRRRSATAAVPARIPPPWQERQTEPEAVDEGEERPALGSGGRGSQSEDGSQGTDPMQGVQSGHPGQHPVKTKPSTMVTAPRTRTTTSWYCRQDTKAAEQGPVTGEHAREAEHEQPGPHTTRPCPPPVPTEPETGSTTGPGRSRHGRTRRPAPAADSTGTRTTPDRPPARRAQQGVAARTAPSRRRPARRTQAASQSPLRCGVVGGGLASG